MYVLNDLFDAGLDRINEKIHRPLPSGKVTKGHAIVFVVLMNLIGLAIPIFSNTLLRIILASTIALIGILYFLPKFTQGQIYH
jgi:geranylgeranylglycerol-phosphate geranylgeranyltransferase